MNKHIDELFKTVINNQYCIGCGVCAGYPHSPLFMKMDVDGKYVPDHIENYNLKFEDDILAICPFSNNGNDENTIGDYLFKSVPGIKHSRDTGYYLKKYAGYVKLGEYRERGSSGGMATWLANKLLEQNMVDAIIHVKASNEQNGLLFSYQVSKNADELNEGVKSKYYPIEMSKVIKYVRDNPARYALIGIPCFIKAIRLLSEKDAQIKESIKYTIGLVCGHLKTDMFAKSLAWQMGIKPSRLSAIDFRVKIQGQDACSYGVEARGTVNGIDVTKMSPTNRLFTTDWGKGFFKYEACDYCDDVLAETADVTVGDAWLPKYLKDSMGTNIVIIRNPAIMKLVEQNIQELKLDELSIDEVFESQAGGFRHRREGLAYRLYLKEKNGEWRPKKRVEANEGISPKRKKIYDQRVTLMEESYSAYKNAAKKDDFNVFIEHMKPYIKDYNKLAKKPFLLKVIRKIKR